MQQSGPGRAVRRENVNREKVRRAKMRRAKVRRAEVRRAEVRRAKVRRAEVRREGSGTAEKRGKCSWLPQVAKPQGPRHHCTTFYLMTSTGCAKH